MIFKIIGYVWAGIGGIGWISSCSSWINSGKIGDHAANYAASETFLIRLIVYFIVFILPGLILVYLGRKKMNAINTPNSKTSKKCPKCAEEIKSEAVVCRFCGADVSQVVPEGKQYPGHMEGCRCKKCIEWGKYNKLCPVCGYKNQGQSVFCANSNCKHRFTDAEIK